MPVQRGQDSKGPYYQYGDSGKKYHYQSGDERSRNRAYSMAVEQGQAIKASKD